TNLGYQWYDSGVAISGATNFSYTTPALTSTHTYSVVVSNACGSINASATITVQTCQAPQITVQPVDMTISLNQSVTLSVTATGSNLTYTWYQAEEGTTTIAGPSSSPSAHTLPLNRTMKFHVRISNNC